MTKAALRREERERQAREGDGPYQDSPQDANSPDPDTITSAHTPATSIPSNIPHMEPPPPYDAPHQPRRSSPGSDRANLGRRQPKHEPDPGCLTFGPGESEGCMNYNSGWQDPSKVTGCMNYDSQDGCMNYRSAGGCLNYESSGGCLNYRSNDGCLNYEVESGDGCLNFKSNRGGCLQFNRR